MQSKIARLLSQSLDQDVNLEQHPTEQGAWQAAEFEPSRYAVLIISEHLPEQNVLTWLEKQADAQDFSQVVLLSKDPKHALTQRLQDKGLLQCLDRNALTRSRLAATVQKAIAQAPTRGEAPTPFPTLDPLDPPTETAATELPSLDELNRPSLDTLPAKKHEQRKMRMPRARKNLSSDTDGKRFSSKHNHHDMIPGYALVKKIGQGGMSVIYLAKRLSDNANVVIKVLSDKLSQNDIQVLRSNQEYTLISRIASPHIVKLTDHGTVKGSTYTVMEHFDSGDLKQRMKEGITQVQALKFMQQICQGLAAIHGCGIIHRDLKPANIMFREDDTLAIIDFGISRDINTHLSLTRPGQIIGTPNYMAPEQGNSSYKPDARSDIYAVGVMLYEMLTGKKPYTAPNAASIIYKHLHDPIPKLPNNFFEMQGLVDNCMAKFPHQRFQSAFDMIDYINSEFRWDITLDFE